ncbi:MAG: uridine kinase [Eubacteriales bacterium]|nr:uridine kinase [Eubacteriales bacterium]
MEESLIIGIAGGSGSGKTTLTNQIASQFRESVTIIKHDDYYKAHDDMTYEERCRLNYDHPNAFDTELMIEHLRQLKKGRAVECPVYDYTIHNRSKDTAIIQPGKVIIVEGILIFENSQLCELMDIRIFVDTDADLRIIRRIQRDVMERARSLESVISQYLNTVKPMHEQFVEPSKKNANIIVPEGGYNKVAMEMIRNHIGRYLDENQVD